MEHSSLILPCKHLDFNFFKLISCHFPGCLSSKCFILSISQLIAASITVIISLTAIEVHNQYDKRELHHLKIELAIFAPFVYLTDVTSSMLIYPSDKFSAISINYGEISGSDV